MQELDPRQRVEAQLGIEPALGRHLAGGMGMSLADQFADYAGQRGQSFIRIRRQLMGGVIHSARPGRPQRGHVSHPGVYCSTHLPFRTLNTDSNPCCRSPTLSKAISAVTPVWRILRSTGITLAGAVVPARSMAAAITIALS